MRKNLTPEEQDTYAICTFCALALMSVLLLLLYLAVHEPVLADAPKTIPVIAYPLPPPASPEAQRIRREQAVAYMAGVNDGLREAMLAVIAAEKSGKPLDWTQAVLRIKSNLAAQEQSK